MYGNRIHRQKLKSLGLPSNLSAVRRPHGFILRDEHEILRTMIRHVRSGKVYVDIESLLTVTAYPYRDAQDHDAQAVDTRPPEPTQLLKC